MKPFDLEKALAGEPVVNGMDKKILKVAYNADAESDCRICAWDEDGQAELYYENGRFDDISTTKLDLFMAEKPKVKKEGWVNVYPDDDVFMYPSLEESEDAKGSKRVACIKIEWEEEA